MEIQGFHIKRDEKAREYLKSTLLENITTGIFAIETLEDVLDSTGTSIEDALEDLSEQIGYMEKVTSKAYIQQLPELTQDQLVQSRNFLAQADKRYTYLSQGRQIEPELLMGNRATIDWEEAKEMAVIGLVKYLNTIKLLMNEVMQNEPLLIESLTDKEVDRFEEFINIKLDILKDPKYMNADFSEMLGVNFEDEGEDDDEDSSYGDEESPISIQDLI